MSAVTDADGDARWVRNLIRRVTSHAVETKIDAQGRITLSEDLLRIAEIRGEAMIVGAFEWIEIWSPDRFETEMYEVDDSYDENLGNLMVVHPSKQAAGDG